MAMMSISTSDICVYMMQGVLYNDDAKSEINRNEAKFEKDLNKSNHLLES